MSLRLPYSTTNQSSLNMRGLYSSVLPPDISCSAGRPAIMFSAWVESEPAREVSCSLFSGPKGWMYCKWMNAEGYEAAGWSDEGGRGVKRSGCWTDTS